MAEQYRIKTKYEYRYELETMRIKSITTEVQKDAYIREKKHQELMLALKIIFSVLSPSTILALINAMLNA